jgi:hypothetical protein
MDGLDRIGADARPLLRRADEIIASFGAPPAHRLWDRVRAVRLLTVDAVDAVTALRPGEFAVDVPNLRASAAGYTVLADDLPVPGQWSGEASEAYSAARQHLADHLAGGAESLAERLEASADLADALVDWMWRSRSGVAAVLAEVLASAEAVLLSEQDGPAGGGSGDGTSAVPVPVMVAAADVAELVLRAVAEVYQEAAELLDGSADLAVAVPAPGRRPASWS